MMHAENVTSNFELVRDYRLRPSEALRMDALLTDINYFRNAVASHSMASVMMVPTLSSSMMTCMIAASPWLIGLDGSEGRLTVGTFLASLTAIKSMGKEAEALFNRYAPSLLCAPTYSSFCTTPISNSCSLMKIQLSISSLLKITKYMNLETDVANNLREPHERPDPDH